MGSSSSSMTGSSTVTVVSATTSFVTYATGLAGVTGGNFSSPVLSPSKSMTVPSTLQSTFTGGANTRSASSTASVAIPESTGAAVANRVVGGMVGLVAGCAAVLAF